MLNNSFLHFLALSFFTNKKRFSGILVVSFFILLLLSSTLFISSSIKGSLKKSLNYQPDFIIQNIKAGESFVASSRWREKLLKIHGVIAVNGRVYGRFFLDKKISFLVIGIDFFSKQTNENLDALVNKIDLKEFLSKENMLVGASVKKYLNSHYYKDSYNFLTPKGEFLKLNIYKELPNSSGLVSQDVVITTKDLAKKILGLSSNEVSDFALSVPNPSERENIRVKIESLFFGARVVTKEDINKKIASLYDYKGGVFLILYLIVIFAFSLILYLRYTIATSIERKEIATLRAVGWSIKDVIKLKLLENLTLIFISFSLAIIASYIFVFIFDAPILRAIFLGGDSLSLNLKFKPYIDYGLISTIFIIYLVTYLATTLIPIWRIAISDPKEVLR